MTELVFRKIVRIIEETRREIDRPSEQPIRMVALGLEGTARNGKGAPGGAPLSAELARSVKMVAGTGFEPVTFRL